MWGKWDFPTSQNLLNLPWNYGCDDFFLENCLVDLDLFCNYLRINTPRIYFVTVFGGP